MTGRQEYDRTKDRQRILGKYMIDEKEKSFKVSANFVQNNQRLFCLPYVFYKAGH
jgi:hypothetical protein